MGGPGGVNVPLGIHPNVSPETDHLQKYANTSQIRI